MQEKDLQTEEIFVRSLKPEDLEAVIKLDSRITGRRREEYFKLKLKQALSDTGIMISLAAELEGCFVGFLLARVYYGEFGKLEQVAVLETLGVDQDVRHMGVGSALVKQLQTNLLGLGIRKVQTEVDWNNQELFSFFYHEGFQPAPRLCLEREIQYAIE